MAMLALILLNATPNNNAIALAEALRGGRAGVVVNHLNPGIPVDCNTVDRETPLFFAVPVRPAQSCRGAP
jgi:hypothetical protein